MKYFRLLALVLVVGVFPGCWRSDDLPNTLGELDVLLQKDLQRATEAASAADGKKAVKCSYRAEAIVKKMEVLAGEEKDNETLRKGRLTKQKIVRLAALATERQKLNKIMNSWKARTYQKYKKGAIKTAFSSLAVAADHAAKVDIEKLPKPIKEQAKKALRLIKGEQEDDEKKAEGKDWRHVAVECRLLAKYLPDNCWVLVLPMLLSGRKELALVEIESEDTKAFFAKHKKYFIYYCLVRVAVYLANGFDHIINEEIFENADLDERIANTPILFGAIHSAMTVYYLSQDKITQADQSLGRAIRCAPNSIFVVYLTGERQAADGQYVKAAESLEALSNSVQGKFLAKQLTERVRLLRDNPHRCEPLIFNSSFALQLIREAVKDPNIQAATRASLEEALNKAYRQGQAVVDQLPTLLPEKLPSKDRIKEKVSEYSALLKKKASAMLSKKTTSVEQMEAVTEP